MYSPKQLLFTIVLAASILMVQSSSPIDVLPPNTEFLRTHGAGTVNYVCQNKVFVMSDAYGNLQKIDDPSANLGTFYYNRLPNSNDTTALFGISGPSVTFKETATTPSANADSLPDALYAVVKTEQGTTGPLEGVTFAQGVNTQSGLLTGNSCNTDGETQKANFRADYVFYRPPSGQYLSAPPTTSTYANTTPTPTPPGSDDIAVPQSNVELMRLRGSGNYNYRCQNSKWEFGSLNGNLFKNDEPTVAVGKLFNSPAPDAKGGQNVFQLDGSNATFIVLKTGKTINVKSLPEVLFATTSTSRGTLGDVTFAQRLNPNGGAPPTTSCSDTDSSNIPFSADYVFFVGSKSVNSTPPSYATNSTANLPNINRFTGAFLGVQPVKIVNIVGQAQPFQVIDKSGSVVGSFTTYAEAIKLACGIQRDECASTASSKGHEKDAVIQQCYDQASKCVVA